MEASCRRSRGDSFVRNISLAITASLVFDSAAHAACVTPATTCGVTNPSPDDPFGPNAPNGPGDFFPNDTKSSCHIATSDFGGTATLINVCSFPSQSPGSAPSDCVLTPVPPNEAC